MSAEAFLAEGTLARLSLRITPAHHGSPENRATAPDQRSREARISAPKTGNRARNWYLLQQKFSLGILALVPRGEFQIGIDK